MNALQSVRAVRWVVIWSVCCGIAASAQSAGQTIGPAEGYESLAEELSAVIRRELDDKQIPSASIALVADGETVWAAGFGIADENTGRPADANTIYRVGSISKLLTDLAVMRLVADGELDLDEPIQTYLPDFHLDNPFDKPITLRQLMSHRSGLVRESPVGHYFDPTEPTIAATVESLNNTSLVYEPESRTKYSNAAVTVAGYVLEKVTGEPYADAVRRLVLQPLEMSDSDYELTPRLRQRLASALMWSYDGREFPAPTFQLGTSPAGNLYSTVVDLARVAVEVADPKVVADHETLAAMLAPQFDDAADFGIGFHLSKLDGHRLVGHGGAVYGYATQFEVLPAEGLAVAMAASRDGANSLVSSICHHALRAMLAKAENGEAKPWEFSTPIPDVRARQLGGRFVHVDGGSDMELLERNGELYLDRGSFRSRLRQLGDDLVVDDVLQHGLKVGVEGTDAVTVGDDRYERAARVRPAEPPESLRGLLGEYGWDHNILFIYERAGRLYCLIEWFYEYPLEPAGDDVYNFPDYGLYHGEQLIFERDDAGRAQRVVAANVPFERRNLQGGGGETFRIEPIRPMEEIREIAAAATPPAEEGDFREADLVELVTLDPTIKLDIRYATTNNFLGAQVYESPRAYLQRPAAEAVARAHEKLSELGFGLLIHDGYRPWTATKMFWEATPESQRIFVANPAEGSRHNRGCAVDLTLYDLATGEPLDMGAGYDEFSPRSYPDYPVATDAALWRRGVLRDVMESEGFTIYEYEWWHFDYRDWRRYSIGNTPFE